MNKLMFIAIALTFTVTSGVIAQEPIPVISSVTESTITVTNLATSVMGRVELGNDPVFENCTQLEIQPITSWTNTSIEIVFNLGGFSVIDTVYLFVIDSNGIASDGFNVSVSTPPVIVEGVPAVEGLIIADNTVGLVGTDFGPHSLDTEWTGDWIETQPGSTTILDKEGWTQGRVSNSPDAIVSSVNAHSGSKSIDSSVLPGQSVKPFIFEHVEPFTEVYFSFWYYMDIHTASASNSTMWRLNGPLNSGTELGRQTGTAAYISTHEVTGPTGLSTILYCESGCPDGLWTVQCWGTDPNGQWNDVNNFSAYRQWVRMEVYLKGSSVDAFDGTVRLAKDGQVTLLNETARTFTYKTGCDTDGADHWERVIFQNSFNNGTATILYDDIYISFGTQARIELGDAPIHEDCTQLEIQPVTEWTDSTAVADVNLGAFNGAETLYLFVINANGEASPGTLFENTEVIPEYEDLGLLQVFGRFGISVDNLEYARKYPDGTIKWKGILEDGTIIYGMMSDKQ